MMAAIKNVVAVLALCALGACSGYGGAGLVVDRDTESDVVRTMGAPAMEWTNADGSRQLVYPRGPGGVHTFMVRIDADGKLSGIQNVLTEEVFAQVRSGLDADAVLRILGPSYPGWTTYYPARNELAWEWRYCDEWRRLARFDVLFDATTRTVRSSMTRREECGPPGACWCAR